MKISGIRVLNNYKMKLINTRLAGVNFGNASVFEQGTRYPTIPTVEEPDVTFEEKFNVVFDYLIQRYEPGWSGGNTADGKLATMNLLGISAPVNPFTMGSTVSNLYWINTNDIGWFDVLAHPKDFASTVRSQYVRYERARKPLKAKHRFIDYQLFGIGQWRFNENGGNVFFNMASNSPWYDVPDDGIAGTPFKSMGLTLNYQNCIERVLMHSPYGHFRSPMTIYADVGKQSLPWLTNRYSPDTGFRFDAYLMLRESSTLRDMLNDSSVVRNPSLGVTVDGVTDTYLNTLYRGMTFPAGYISTGGFAPSGRPGGYSANPVSVGSPWIKYPTGLTWTGALTQFDVPGLCFNQQTLILFDGTTFPINPPDITDRYIPFYPGISYGRGEAMLANLNSLSAAWGNSMEFIAYLGFLPYGAPKYEYLVPFALYKDPTVAENVRYTKWRLDASVKHWKEKFKSPIDGFAHVFLDAGVGMERTLHQYLGPGYTAWTNILPSGQSYVENIPVSWARDQYAYTYGNSGPNADKGVVLGQELWGWYDFEYSSSSTDHKKSSSDSKPRHWALDSDIACPLYTTFYDMINGQRRSGITNANQIWGMGVCGSTELGEMFCLCRPTEARRPQDQVDGYPFFYNTFTEYNGTNLVWKQVPATSYLGVDGIITGVPWYHDRRFRLFYLYPIALALDGTIVDIMHNGSGYLYATESGWYDKTKGVLYKNDMWVTGLVTPATPPRNFWNGIARTSEFELLYACMKGGVTAGLDSLFFTELYNDIASGTVDQ